MRESCFRAKLYNVRPSPTTKKADNFTKAEKEALKAALAAKDVPSDEALLEKLTRHYVLTGMITMARTRVTIGGIGLFPTGSTKSEWPADNTPTHILTAAIHNIANTHQTYGDIVPYVEKWEKTFHDFAFGTGETRKLHLPCPSATCATPRLPAPRALPPPHPPRPAHPRRQPLPSRRNLAQLNQPCTTLHKPSAPNVPWQGPTSPLGGGGDPKPETEQAPLGRAEPHEHGRARRQRSGGQKKEDQEGDEQG